MLSVSISAFLFIIFASYITLNYYQVTNETIRSTAETQENNLQLLNTQLENQLSHIEGQSVTLSRQNTLNRILRDNTSHYQRNILNMEISNVAYTDSLIDSVELYYDGVLPPQRENQPVKYGSLTSPSADSLMDTLGDKNVSWIGMRDFSLYGNKWPVISHARKLRNFKGEMHALMLMNINPLALSEWLAQFSNNSVLLLLDQNNQVLASTDIGLIGGQYLFDRKQTNLFPRSKEESLVVMNEVASNNWKIISLTPYHILTETSRSITENMIIISIIVSLITILAAILLISKVTSPLKQLIHLMKHHRLNRDSQDQIPTDYENEFGEIFAVYKDLTERNKYLLKEVVTHHEIGKRAELRALQANINPHFLYNTLDQLNWRAIDNDDDDMSTMIELLGDMLRIGLSKGESIITIEREVQYVQKYLDLQKIRLKHKLSYSISLDPSISQAYIPKLTLQPFVENAIIHGFNEQETGHIAMTLKKEDPSTISIMIQDNGSGATTFEKKHTKATGGYGIRNVSERLDNYFNEKVDLTLENHPVEGVLVTIRIPYLVELDAFNNGR